MNATLVDTPEIWAFDCEWTPDLVAGRRLYHLGADLPDDEVLRVMWQEGGATPEDPTPFLKTILCRVCSIATVVRKGPRGNPKLSLLALPENPDDPAQDEKYILMRFLEDGVSRHAPTLVGYNSRNADIHILAQRAIVNGLQLPRFRERLDAKPWNSPDVDLMDILGGRGKGYSASLNEVANLCGIPGKLDTTGDDVAGLFYGGRRRKIVEYNMFDALTTYLVWLRVEFFGGHFTPDEYCVEQSAVRTLLAAESTKPDGAYLRQYIDAWQALTPVSPVRRSEPVEQ